MVPHDQPHQRLSRWMRESDPVLASWKERYAEAGVEWEIVTTGDLCMIYAHEKDGSCCEITNRNREEEQPMYVRGKFGEILRGR